MNEKFAFSYCLLQYRHNPWLHERLNIGVLVLSEKANFLKMRLRSWHGRVTHAYPDLNKAAFTEDLKQFQRAIEHYSKKEFVQPTFFAAGPKQEKTRQGNAALTLASTLAPTGDASYQWADGGVGVSGNLEAKTEILFNRFVEPYSIDRKQPKRSDDEVWAKASKLIRERNLENHIDT